MCTAPIFIHPASAIYGIALVKFRDSRFELGRALLWIPGRSCRAQRPCQEGIHRELRKGTLTTDPPRFRLPGKDRRRGARRSERLQQTCPQQQRTEEEDVDAVSENERWAAGGVQ